MSSIRSRKRAFKKLKGNASSVWDDQKKVLDEAAKVVRDAGKQLQGFASDDVAPKVRKRVSSYATSGVAAGQHFATATQHRIADGVIPAATAALSSASTVLDTVKDPKVRKAVQKRIEKQGKKASKDFAKKADAIAIKAGIKEPAPGPGRYLLIGLVVVAVAGIGYAVWQTLRADDDLWIEDDPTTDNPVAE